MSTPSERESVEALADLIAAARHCWGADPEGGGMDRHIATVVHNHLAARDAEQRARGWDEGYSAGAEDSAFEISGWPSDAARFGYPHTNPHRAAALDAQAEAGGSDG